MFTFSFKFSQTLLIIKELIEHENKFNRKVFHDTENSENRFSEFWYFMKGFKKYTWIFLGSETQWNYRERRISWNALKETFHSVSSPIENNSFHEDNSIHQVIENAKDLFISDHETPLPQVTLQDHRKLFYGGGAGGGGWVKMSPTMGRQRSTG